MENLEQETKCACCGNEKQLGVVDIVEVPVDSTALAIEKFKSQIKERLEIIKDEEQRAYWSKILYAKVTNEEDVDQWHEVFHTALDLTSYPTSLFKKDKVDTALINFKCKEQTHSIARMKDYISELNADIVKTRQFRTELQDFKKLVIAQKSR